MAEFSGFSDGFCAASLLKGLTYQSAALLLLASTGCMSTESRESGGADVEPGVMFAALGKPADPGRPVDPGPPVGVPRPPVAPDCGNGSIQKNGEECDDGNTVDGDGCSAVCVVEFCGDSLVNNSGTEACDDGNTVDGDGCDAICVVEFCGVCSTNHNAAPACMAGQCVGVCDAGFQDCNGDMATDGCETGILSDPANCGACGHVCSANQNAAPACMTGLCVGVCDAGFQDCNGDMATDGCETGLMSDPANCGVCGRVCSTNHNAAPACTAFLCVGVCDAGFQDCNGDMATDGCETGLLSDPANCGACGHVCSANQNAAPACMTGLCGTVAGDNTVPTASQTTPANGATGIAVTQATIAVTFNEAIDPTTVTASSITLTGGTSPTIAAPSFNGTNTVATFGLSGASLDVATYTTTTVAGIKDPAGNSLVAGAIGTFTTSAVGDGG